jgi:hypothetical protein
MWMVLAVAIGLPLIAGILLFRVPLSDDRRARAAALPPDDHLQPLSKHLLHMDR